MDILTFFETLASHAGHTVDLDTLLRSQPDIVRDTLRYQKAEQLRPYLANNALQADRNTILF